MIILVRHLQSWAIRFTYAGIKTFTVLKKKTELNLKISFEDSFMASGASRTKPIQCCPDYCGDVFHEVSCMTNVDK
jgi:hypothetical protein